MPKPNSETEHLIIDRAAAAEIPSAETVKSWARTKRAFVSSVMSDLLAERQAAAAAIRAVGAKPILFEQFGGRDADPENAYLGEVETSDIYIGILGRRYGRPLPSRYSATHSEYLHAEKHGLRIAVWTRDDKDREGNEQSFLDEVRVFHVVPSFMSPDDLRAQIEERLTGIAAEDLSPWCKLGNVLFRATEIEDHGDKLTVAASVRSDDVAHTLEGLRGDSYARGQDMRFTWAGRSRYVRVQKVESTTRASRSRDMRLQLEAKETPQDHLTEMTIDNMSPADLTEAAMKSALFGAPNPLGKRHLGFFAEMNDPFGPLRRAAVSDEIARPLAELLIAEALVGSGRAKRVTEFKLGAAIRGLRCLTFSWESSNRYSGRKDLKTISGEVRL